MNTDTKIAISLIFILFCAVGEGLSGVMLVYTIQSSTPESISLSTVQLETYGLYGFGVLAVIGMVVSSWMMRVKRDEQFWEIQKHLDELIAQNESIENKAEKP